MMIAAVVSMIALTGFLAWNGNVFLAFVSLCIIDSVAKLFGGNT